MVTATATGLHNRDLSFFIKSTLQVYCNHRSYNLNWCASLQKCMASSQPASMVIGPFSTISSSCAFPATFCSSFWIYQEEKNNHYLNTRTPDVSKFLGRELSKLSNWTFRNVKSGKTQIGLPLKKLKLAKTKSGDPGEEKRAFFPFVSWLKSHTKHYEMTKD